MYDRLPNHSAVSNDTVVTGFAKIQIILQLIICWIFYAKAAN